MAVAAVGAPPGRRPRTPAPPPLSFLSSAPSSPNPLPKSQTRNSFFFFISREREREREIEIGSNSTAGRGPDIEPFTEVPLRPLPHHRSDPAIEIPSPPISPPPSFAGDLEPNPSSATPSIWPDPLATATPPFSSSGLPRPYHPLQFRLEPNPEHHQIPPSASHPPDLHPDLTRSDHLHPELLPSTSASLYCCSNRGSRLRFHPHLRRLSIELSVQQSSSCSSEIFHSRPCCPPRHRSSEQTISATAA